MVLMSRRELDRLGNGDLSQTFDLTIADPDKNSVTLKDLVLVRAIAIAPEIEDAKDTPYYLEIADQRVLWSMAKIDAAYNVRDSAGSTSSFLSATKNGGSNWTWATMFASLWSSHGLLGTQPALPYTPDGTPEGWIFYAANAWDAINNFLDRIGCAFKIDPLTGTKSIVRRGYDTTGAGARAAARLAKFRIWDNFEVEPEYGRLPEKVTVRFRKSPIPTDGTSWYYTVDVADTETTEALTGTRVILDDDLLALYNTVPAITNAAGCATRAAERAAAWFKAARLAGQKESLEYRGIRGTDAVVALGSLYGEVAWLDRGSGYRTALAARLAKGDGWTGSQAEVFVTDPVQAIDISGRSGSVADVTALQILRGVISGTAGAAVFTPDDASASLPGDVNLSDQKLGMGRKTVEELGIGESAFGTTMRLYQYSAQVIRMQDSAGATQPRLTLPFGGSLQFRSIDDTVEATIYYDNTAGADCLFLTVNGSSAFKIAAPGTTPTSTSLPCVVGSQIIAAQFSADFDGTYAGRKPGATATVGGMEFAGGLYITGTPTVSSIDGGTF
jgi:hypothetical protein